jgi:hypothetical protein
MTFTGSFSEDAILISESVCRGFFHPTQTFIYFLAPEWDQGRPPTILQIVQSVPYPIAIFSSSPKPSLSQSGIKLDRRPTLHARAASSLDAAPADASLVPVRSYSRKSESSLKRMWKRLAFKVRELSARASRAEEVRERGASREASSGWSSRLAPQAASCSASLAGKSKKTKSVSLSSSNVKLTAAPNGAGKEAGEVPRSGSLLKARR